MTEIDNNPNDDSPQMAEWFYQLLGLSTGPVKTDRMEQLVKNQHLVAATLIGHSAEGPWQRLDESEFKALLPQKSEVEKKKGVRISSRSFRTQRRTKPVDTNVDHSEVVIEGIEIDNGIKLVPRVPRVPRMPPAADTDDSATKTLDFQTDDSAAWDQFEQETAQIQAVTEPVPALVQSKPVVASKPKKDRKKKKAPADPDRAERRKRVGLISLGAVALLGLFLVRQNWSDGPDGREAYAVFRRVGTAFETNSESMNDNEWALFIRDSRKEVNAVLEPLRDEVSSDYPE